MNPIKLYVYDLENNLISESDFRNVKDAEKYIEGIEKKERPFHQPKEGIYYELPSGTIEYKIDSDSEGKEVYKIPCHYTYNIVDETEKVNQELKYQEILKAGMNDRKCCEEILYLIGGYNRSRNLTAEQITKMIKDFADIDTCLAKGRPTSAKYLIQKLKIDGESLTQDLYNLVMEAFKRFNIWNFLKML